MEIKIHPNLEFEVLKKVMRQTLSKLLKRLE